MAFNPNPLRQQLIDALERILEGNAPPSDQIEALTKALRFDQTVLEVRGRELSEVQRALEESKKRCAELYEQAPVAYVTLDEAGRICDLNEAAAAFLGVPQRQLCDSLFSARLHPGEADRFYRYLRLCRHQSGQTANEFALRIDNTARHAQLLCAPVVSAGGEWLLRCALIDVTAQRHVERQLQQCEARLRNLVLRPDPMREDDRAELASELHERLGPTLAGLDSDIAWLNHRLAVGPDDVRGKLDELSRLTQDALDALRHTGERLWAMRDETPGLAGAIGRAAMQFQEQYEIVCVLDLALDGIEPDGEHAAVLFQIVQEALTNVARHASASRVAVRCMRDDELLVLAIEDDGRGFDEEKLRERGSHVLRDILQRAQSIDGKVRIKSRRGAGSTITVSIPLSRIQSSSPADGEAAGNQVE